MSLLHPLGIDVLELAPPGGPPPRRRADGDGRLRIDRLAPGRYTVGARWGGRLSPGVSVEARAGESRAVEVHVQ